SSRIAETHWRKSFSKPWVTWRTRLVRAQRSTSVAREFGGSQLPAPSWQQTNSLTFKLEDGGWKLEAGNWKLQVMAGYKRGYRRYEGPLTGRWTRFLVLPRYAWRRLYEQRLVLLLTMASFVWPLLCAGFIYLTNHAELLQGLGKDFLAFIQVNGRFFSIFMYVQAGFAVFLAALAGPSLVAPDLSNNALPLYF